MFFCSFFVFFSLLVVNYDCLSQEMNQQKINKINAINKVDIEILAQITLDLNALENYYHVDVLPERSPLVVINNIVNQDINLNKFGKDIVYMEKDEAVKNGKAYFEFTSFNIDSKNATVKFLYPIEGIAGKVIFEKNNSEWKINHWEIVER